MGIDELAGLKKHVVLDQNVTELGDEGYLTTRLRFS